ncbi:restriction endonuclease subunit S [Clostridium perfringens]|uniref:Restriction endonuclease subunit S n=2 Tax=Clostridium perfringens TaxID=1502 RepID=A0AAP6WMT4_CLOPF|nr:restriction endonuclease subunit S [Clostridium perfringens]EDT23067.1 type-I specificity determinant subunit [Clostridium perfringens B str. ATCC 3626]NGU30032.1 restriction endonuclease subunit S [Clostridium perfringens]WEV06412.1 restriction endonuclease subunit S [Clostridium perfringens B]WEV09506.1 restriction endonuclease subunit S [Clostridium perfringens B]
MSRNVPKLRFKGFEDEWKDEKLGDFLMKSTDVTTEHTDIPVLTSSRRGLFLQSEYFNREVAAKDTTGYNILKRGYFTYRHMSDDSTFHFNINRFIDIGLVSPEYPVFTTKQDLNSYFLEQHLNSSLMFSKFCKMQKKGGTRTRLYFKVLENYKLKLPTLQEQEKIANFLSKVDSIIEKQEKKVEYWSSYKKGMMQKIFKQEIRFKDENGMDYPEWKINKIENIATIEMGFTPSTKNDEAWNGNIDWLSIAGMNSKYIYSGNKKISSEILGKRKLVPIDTLIMSFKLTIGRLAIVKKDIVTNEAICQFYWKSKDISNEYMYAYLSVINIQSFGCRAAKGITLNTESLNSIVVKLPCLEEQTKIANFLSNIDNIIDKESKKLEELKQWKKGLLQQMFV